MEEKEKEAINPKKDLEKSHKSQSDLTSHEKESKKSSDKNLFGTIVVFVVILIIIFSLRAVMKPEEPKTIDELHLLNIQGELRPSQGYMYGGYSFVNVSYFWYTQMKSQGGTTLYTLDFRYGPKQVEDIVIKGRLDAALFDSATEYHITFNPVGFDGDFTYVTLAVSDFNQNMVKVFKKKPIAACDRNETDACRGRPIINCDSPGVVFYVQEAEETKVLIEDNCIMVKGTGFDLVRGVDKLLFELYGIKE
jgi:hypothetical protein